MYDSLNMHSLESSLIDIIRAEQEPLKGKTRAIPSSRFLLPVRFLCTMTDSFKASAMVGVTYIYIYLIIYIYSIYNISKRDERNIPVCIFSSLFRTFISVFCSVYVYVYIDYIYIHIQILYIYVCVCMCDYRKQNEKRITAGFPIAKTTGASLWHLRHCKDEKNKHDMTHNM